MDKKMYLEECEGTMFEYRLKPNIRSTYISDQTIYIALPGTNHASIVVNTEYGNSSSTPQITLSKEELKTFIDGLEDIYKKME